MYKAYLVNPTAKKIERVLIPEKNGLKTKQTLINGIIAGMGYIKPNGRVGDDTDDMLYCDDDGLAKNSTDFVYIKGFGQQLYRGNVLITGSDGEGGDADVKMSFDEVEEYFNFVSRYEVDALLETL